MKRILLIIALLIPQFVEAQGSLLPDFMEQYSDNAGNPVASGFICSTISGTSTNLATYPTAADANAGTNPNANPVQLDSAGRGTIWMGQGTYRLVLLNPVGMGSGSCNGTATGSAIKTVDGALRPIGGATGTADTIPKFNSINGLTNSDLTDGSGQVLYPNWPLSTTSAFKINESGSLGAHATSQPAGTDWRPMQTLDLSNPATGSGGKQGLYVNTKMTSSSGTREMTGIWVDSYSLGDNGGEVSGYHGIDTGAGDTMSLFHLASERPAGYAIPCATCGFGLEIGVDHGDGIRVNIHDNLTDNVAFQGRGISIVDQATTSGFSDILITPTSPGTGAGRFAITVSNTSGTDVRFQVAADTGYITAKSGGVFKGNLEFTNNHGVYFDLQDATQSFITSDTTTGQLIIQGGDGVGSGGTISANFVNNASVSILQVLKGGGIAIPAATNQILVNNTTLLNFPANAGLLTLVFATTGGKVPVLQQSDGRLYGWDLSSSDLGGTNLWLNAAGIGSISAATNASYTFMSNVAGFARISSNHSGTGTTLPLGLFVDATNILKGETSGTDRTCIYINGALRLLSISGGAVIDGGACP